MPIDPAALARNLSSLAALDAEHDLARAMQLLTRTAETGEVWQDLAVVAGFALAGLALGAATLRRRTA